MAPDASDPSTRETDPETSRARPKRPAAGYLGWLRYVLAARAHRSTSDLNGGARGAPGCNFALGGTPGTKSAP